MPETTLPELIASATYPCVAAKAALQRDQITQKAYGDLREADNDASILADLADFVKTYREDGGLYRSFAAHFAPSPMSEVAFERALWGRLQALHLLDTRKHAWDDRVSADPADDHFSFSLCGEAFFIIGLHPAASRTSRRFATPTLVFNLHDQFERLRRDGGFERMREVIRRRDAELCGSANPTIRDYGTGSEARQYSGRAVEDAWRCPFRAAG